MLCLSGNMTYYIHFSSYTCQVNCGCFQLHKCSWASHGILHINPIEATSNTQFHQHEQAHPQERLPSSASNSQQIQVSSCVHLLSVVAAHQPRQNHPANNWWEIINNPLQDAFFEGESTMSDFKITVIWWSFVIPQCAHEHLTSHDCPLHACKKTSCRTQRIGTQKADAAHGLP